MKSSSNNSVGFGCALLVSILACQAGETTLPAPPPATILVTNASCDAGRCMTLEVRAFVWAFLIPQPPIGLRILAEVPPGQTCLALPATMSVTVIGANNTGKVDTVVTTWQQSDPGGIYLVAVDSAAWHGHPSQAQTDSINRAVYPYDGLQASVGETSTFIPADSPGWRVTFPSTPVFGGAIMKASNCHP